MPTKVVDLGIQKVAWVTTLEDPQAPKLTELTAGFDLSCLLLPSYNVDFADSDTVSERALCETTNSTVITIGNYEGQLDLFRSYTTDGAADTDDPLTKFVPNTFPVGYIVRRVGPPQADAWATGDKVEVWKFQADNPKVKGGTNEGYLKASVKLVPQGLVVIDAAVVAGA